MWGPCQLFIAGPYQNRGKLVRTLQGPYQNFCTGCFEASFKLQRPAQGILQESEGSSGRAEIQSTSAIQAAAPLEVSKHSGRLRFFESSWREITNDEIILEFVKGYQIPFSCKVFQGKRPNVSNFINTEFRDCFVAVKDLMDKGSVRECRPCKGQFISSYFLIDKSNGQKRFILNLKKLNRFINPPHFKLEDHKTVTRLLTPNCYMASIDLKDAYLLVPVAEKYRKYLRFEFNQKLYEFDCLPFGLCTAPYVFTKLMNNLIAGIKKSRFFIRNLFR